MPTVITRKVDEIKQKHSKAPPNVTAMIGDLLFFGLQPHLWFLSITSTPIVSGIFAGLKRQ
jgi:hypothetical protein